MVVLSKIVTKTGDSGYTSLANGARVSKDSSIIMSIGNVDELNSIIGIITSLYFSNSDAARIVPHLKQIQNDLFDLGADLSYYYSPEDDKLRITENHISKIEDLIDEWNSKLSPLNSFILPGGSMLSAYIHFARTVARRAERSVVMCKNKNNSINPAIIVYLNRLSDLLFILGRITNDNGKKDILWIPGGKV